jgi:isoquinoline 1-oxidoreductase beta subunit
MPAPTGPLSFPIDYVQIDPDDRVLVWSAQPEMGEGTKTSLPMLVAEELDADWTRCGSRTHRSIGSTAARASAAAMRFDRIGMRCGVSAPTARACLIAAAAAQWNVPASECDTSAHVVRHPASGREAPLRVARRPRGDAVGAARCAA